MFDDYGNFSAREALVAIARLHAARLKPEGQTKALEYVDLIFQKWKFEQMADDGTIELSPFSLGLLSGITLSEMANMSPRRVPVGEVRPEQCAGPSVRCRFDLLMHLYREKYPPMIRMADRVALSVIAALLVVHDYKTMPLGGLAWAIRLIWASVDGERQATYAELDRVGRAESNREKQRQDAQVNGQLANAERKRRRDVAIDKMGLEYFRANPNAREPAAAAHIHTVAKAGNWRDFSNVTQRGIENTLKLGKVKQRALDSLARE